MFWRIIVFLASFCIFDFITGYKMGGALYILSALISAAVVFRFLKNGLAFHKMKKERVYLGCLTCITVMMLLAFSGVKAQEKGFGLGVIVGEPTGISAKGWISTA